MCALKTTMKPSITSARNKSEWKCYHCSIKLWTKGVICHFCIKCLSTRKLCERLLQLFMRIWAIDKTLTTAHKKYYLIVLSKLRRNRKLLWKLHIYLWISNCEYWNVALFRFMVTITLWINKNKIGNKYIFNVKNNNSPK